MGEWSEYFDDFPEENAANYINGQYVGPKAASEYRRNNSPTGKKTNSEDAKKKQEILEKQHEEMRKSFADRAKDFS